MIWDSTLKGRLEILCIKDISTFDTDEIFILLL